MVSSIPPSFLLFFTQRCRAHHARHDGGGGKFEARQGCANSCSRTVTRAFLSHDETFKCASPRPCRVGERQTEKLFVTTREGSYYTSGAPQRHRASATGVRDRLFSTTDCTFRDQAITTYITHIRVRLRCISIIHEGKRGGGGGVPPLIQRFFRISLGAILKKSSLRLRSLWRATAPLRVSKKPLPCSNGGICEEQSRESSA